LGIKHLIPTAKPFDAVYLTAANLAEAAEWCGGTVTGSRLGPLIDMSLADMVPGTPWAGTPGMWLIKEVDGRFRFTDELPEHDWHAVRSPRGAVDRQRG
jgi:hypothetical protein